MRLVTPSSTSGPGEATAVDADGVRAVAVGTIAWAVAAVVLWLFFRDQLAASGFLLVALGVRNGLCPGTAGSALRAPAPSGIPPPRSEGDTGESQT